MKKTLHVEISYQKNYFEVKVTKQSHINDCFGGSSDIIKLKEK